MKVLRDATYTINNVIKFRGLLAISKMREMVEKMSEYIEANEAIKSGELITTTHVLYLEARISDMEIIMPINKAIPSTTDFIFMPVFTLNNCVTTKHSGHPKLLPVTYTKLYHKAKGMGLELEPPFYNVFNEDMNGILDLDTCEANIYVSARLQ